MLFAKFLILISLFTLAVAPPVTGEDVLYRLPAAVNAHNLELAGLMGNDTDLAAGQQTAVFSFKLNPHNLLQFKSDVDLLHNDSTEAQDIVLLPQMFVAVGNNLYAGLGTHYVIEDGVLSADPRFNLRAGVDLEILPYVFLDISADYRFDDWRDLQEEDAFSEDDVVWGGALRIQF